MGSHHSWKQPQSVVFLTSSFQHFSYDARWTSSFDAFHLAEWFVDQGHRHTGKGPAVGGGPQGSCFLAIQIRYWAAQHSAQPMPSSCLCQWAQAHQHRCVHNNHQQRPGLCGPSVWLYGKHHHHLGIPWQIPPSLPQTLPARWYALPRAWCQCRQFLLLPSCLRSSGFEPCTLLLHSFVHLFIPPPDFRFPLMVLGETRDFCGSIQQRTLQLWPSWLKHTLQYRHQQQWKLQPQQSSFFNLESRLELATSSWVAELPSLDAGENLCFFTWGMWAVKSHTTMWCCLTHSSSGMTFKLLTALLKLLW